MKTILLLLLSFCMAACSSEKGNKTGENVALAMLQNPILPGYFADPSVVQYEITGIGIEDIDSTIS